MGKAWDMSERGKAFRRAWNKSPKGRALIERNQAQVREAKNKPCADCGVKYHHYVMDLDHVRGQKSFPLAKVNRTISAKVIAAEIAKCEVVCANCHRERTYGRNNISRVSALRTR